MEAKNTILIIYIISMILPNSFNIYSFQSFLPLKRKYDKAKFILNTIINMNKEHLLPYMQPNIKYNSFKPITIRPFYYTE